MIYLEVDHGRVRYRLADEGATAIETSIALSTGKPVLVERSYMGYYEKVRKLIFSTGTQWTLEERNDV